MRVAGRVTVYVAVKGALVALLAVNGALYALHGTAGEAADALAWFVLLLLFYAETTFAPEVRSTHVEAAIRWMAATLAYLHAHAWLDAANNTLWIALVALLETQVRRPGLAQRWRLSFRTAAVVIYGALAVIPIIWVMEREWFAAYDALLWLAAFATIEADLWPARLAAA
jgi:hypothetical protein